MATIIWTPEETAGHRKLWVEALRSGRFQQGRERLKTINNEFCCLGVACEISGLGAWTEGGLYAVGEIDRSATILPTAVRDWLGLVNNASNYEDGQLTVHNDAGASFAEIADLIDSDPRGLVLGPAK